MTANKGQQLILGAEDLTKDLNNVKLITSSCMFAGRQIIQYTISNRALHTSVKLMYTYIATPKNSCIAVDTTTWQLARVLNPRLQCLLTGVLSPFEIFLNKA